MSYNFETVESVVTQVGNITKLFTYSVSLSPTPTTLSPQTREFNGDVCAQHLESPLLHKGQCYNIPLIQILVNLASRIREYQRDCRRLAKFLDSFHCEKSPQKESIERVDLQPTVG